MHQIYKRKTDTREFRIERQKGRKARGFILTIVNQKSRIVFLLPPDGFRGQVISLGMIADHNMLDARIPKREADIEDDARHCAFNPQAAVRVPYYEVLQ